MAKAAFISDVHIGNHQRCGGALSYGMNERCRQALDTLRRAGELIVSEGCDHLFILGDLFESANPGPRIVAATMEVLSDINSRLEDGGVVAMPGNHDMVSDYQGDHALGPLRWTSKTVAEGKWTFFNFGEDEHVLMVPHRKGVAAEYLAEFLPFAKTVSAGVAVGFQSEGSQEKRMFPPACEEAGKSSASRLPLRALALHLGITTPTTPEYLRNDAAAINYLSLAGMAREHGFRTVLAGHWHQHWVSKPIDGVTLVQVGALCPRGWSDPGMVGYGRVVVLESGKFPAVHEVGGPRFLIANGTGGLGQVVRNVWFYRKKADGVLPYADWRVPVDYVEEAGKQLQESIEAGDIYRGEVNIEDSGVRDGAREAAASIRRAGSLDEAVAKYVAEMDLSVVVRREKVLELAKGYLKES